MGDWGLGIGECVIAPVGIPPVGTPGEYTETDCGSALEVVG